MTCGGSSIVIDGEEEREDFKAMELYLESPFNVDVDIMPPSEMEKLFRAFAEERKRELPQFTPDGIPITLENKFDDAIYNYLYEYWKTNSGEYDPKKDVIPESEMNKMHPKTKNEKKFEQWLLQQYGMTKKEQRGYTLEGNLDSLWEIFSAADMVLLAKALPNIGKNLAKLGKNVGDDVAEEAIEKTVKKEAAEEMAESTAKKEVTDTAEDLSRKTIDKDDALEDSNVIKRRSETDILFEEMPSGNPQYYTSDLLQVTGKAAKARKKAIEAILKEDFPDLNLTYKPEYSPFIRTGIAQQNTGTQIGKNMFISRNELRDTIIHEELHHRWWKRGIVNHHPIGTKKEQVFYEIIKRYKKMRGWN